MVRLPEGLENRLVQVRRAAARLEQTLDRAPGGDEVAEALGWPVARVQAVPTAEIVARPVSLDAPVAAWNDGEGRVLMDALADEARVAPDAATERVEVGEKLRAALGKLGETPSRYDPSCGVATGS